MPLFSYNIEYKTEQNCATVITLSTSDYIEFVNTVSEDNYVNDVTDPLDTSYAPIKFYSRTIGDIPSDHFYLHRPFLVIHFLEVFSYFEQYFFLKVQLFEKALLV